MKHLVKKLGCVCLTLVMLMALALPIAAEDLLVATAANVPEKWDGTIATAFAGGTGTEADPYLISNAKELALIAKNVNEQTTDYLDVYFKQTADINLDGAAWEAIGNGKTAVSFKGNYDGGNFTIYNILNTPIDPSDVSTMIYNGLFGWIADPAVIQNIKMVGGSITSTKYAAAIVGYMNGGTVYNCVSDVDAIYGFQTGGIVGRAEKGEKNVIKGCVNHSPVTVPTDGSTQSSVFVGGIAGCAGNAEILYCMNYGDITSNNGTSYSVAGGIVGIQGASSSPAIIENCMDMGVVTAKALENTKNIGAGGICGKAAHVSFAEITDCFTAGTYTCDKEGYAGGIAGLVDGAKIVSVDNLYTTSDKAAGNDELQQMTAMTLKEDEMKGTAGIAKMNLNSAWIAEVDMLPTVDVTKIAAAEEGGVATTEKTTEATTTEATTTEATTTEATTTEATTTETTTEATTTEATTEATTATTTEAPDETEPTDPVDPPKVRNNTVLIVILIVAIVAVIGGMVAVLLSGSKKKN